MITLNELTRTLEIPKEELLFGVTSDERSSKREFTIPRFTSNHMDLATARVRINYINAMSEVWSYNVPEVTSDDEFIYFEWVFDRAVTMYSGTVAFIVCCIIEDGEKILYEWNSAIAKGTVVDGIETEFIYADDELIRNLSRIVDELETRIDTVEAGKIGWVDVSGRDLRFFSQPGEEEPLTIITIPETEEKLSKLSFRGAVIADYDGRSEVTVNVPDPRTMSEPSRQTVKNYVDEYLGTKVQDTSNSIYETGVPHVLFCSPRMGMYDDGSVFRFQSITTNGNGTFFIVGGSNPEGTNGRIIRFTDPRNPAAGTYADLPIEHANSVCYANGYLYVIPYGTNSKKNILKINADTLQIVETITVSAYNEVGAIDYYDGYFYLQEDNNGSGGVVKTKDFVSFTSIFTSGIKQSVADYLGLTPAERDTYLVGNDICVNNGIIYKCYCYKGLKNTRLTDMLIGRWDAVTGKILPPIKIGCRPDDELESLCFVKDKAFIATDGKAVSIYEMERGKYGYVDYQELVNGSDLNKMFGVGTWYCSNSANKQTMLHTPEAAGNSGFSITIEQYSFYVRRQVYTAIASNMNVYYKFERFGYDNGTTYIWGNWLRMYENGKDLEPFVKSVVGEDLSELKEDLNSVKEQIAKPSTGGISDKARTLLISILSECITGKDQTNVIAELNKELKNSNPSTPDQPSEPQEPTLLRIEVVYNGGSVPQATNVSDLTDIVVKAFYSDGTSSNVTDYTIVGEIAVGDNEVTVIYNGKEATFTVVGTEQFDLDIREVASEIIVGQRPDGATNTNITLYYLENVKAGDVITLGNRNGAQTYNDLYQTVEGSEGEGDYVDVLAGGFYDNYSWKLYTVTMLRDAKKIKVGSINASNSTDFNKLALRWKRGL